MADVKKIKTVDEHMEQRIICADSTQAIATINRLMTEISDFAAKDIVAVGMGQDEEGKLVFDEEIYAGNRVMIALVQTQIPATKNSNGVEVTKGYRVTKAVVISPVPSIETILADENGRKWAERMIDNALNANAVREIRKPATVINEATLAVILDAMPKTLDDYITSNRGGSSTLLEAFDKLWKDVKNALGTLSPAFKAADIKKDELAKCIQSASYAKRLHVKMETAKKGSIFAFAGQVFKQMGEKNGYDTSLFDTWIANRNSVSFDSVLDFDAEDIELSLDSLAAKLAPAVEPEEEEPAVNDGEAEQPAE